MLIAVYGSVLSIGTTITIQEGGSHDIILIALAALIIGYAIYGKIVDSVFGPTDRETPAIRLPTSVSYPAGIAFAVVFLLLYLKSTFWGGPKSA